MLPPPHAAGGRERDIGLSRRPRERSARLQRHRIHSHHAGNPFARQRQAVSHAGQPGRRYPGGLFAHGRRGLSVEGRAARPEKSLGYRQQRADAAPERGACPFVDRAGSIERELKAAAQGVASVILRRDGRNRGIFGIRVQRLICDDPPRFNRRDDHGFATPTELRILRQGSPAACCGSAHLLLRMHVLRGLRREQAAQRMPELRRRFCRAADPACKGMAPLVRREASTVGQARAFVL
jgi:hypothetical protein